MTESTKLYIKTSSYVDIVKEANQDDEWDRDDTQRTHYVDQVSLDPVGYEYCYIPGSIKKGDTVYLVYAVWSTGDSFHRAEGEYIDFISAHRTYDAASRNENILDTDRAEGEGSTFKLFLDDGTEFSYCASWFGYFESLDYVTVREFTVT